MSACIWQKKIWRRGGVKDKRWVEQEEGKYRQQHEKLKAGYVPLCKRKTEADWVV